MRAKKSSSFRLLWNQFTQPDPEENWDHKVDDASGSYAENKYFSHLAPKKLIPRFDSQALLINTPNGIKHELTIDHYDMAINHWQTQNFPVVAK